jgi:uncharacterized phage protein gp47/JayE
MAFPIPTPAEIAELQASAVEAELRQRDATITDEALARAVRSPDGVMAILLRAQALGVATTHYHLAWIAREVMPDTAVEWLPRHGAIWGVPRRPALAAIGRVTLTGTVGASVPLATPLATQAGVRYLTTAVATIPVGGSVSVPVIADVPGVAGNRPAGATLSLVSPIAGIESRVVVATGGLAGGTELEGIEAWRARILARIQAPPHGGAEHDYIAWVREAVDASHVRVGPNWVGRGTLGIIVAMRDSGPAGVRAPTTEELQRVADYIAARRPVTVSQISIVAAVLTPVPLTIEVEPFTAPVVAAVEAAARAAIARDRAIMGRIIPSRISELISAARGEYAHRIITPAAAYQLGPTAIGVPGTITVQGAP